MNMNMTQSRWNEYVYAMNMYNFEQQKKAQKEKEIDIDKFPINQKVELHTYHIGHQPFERVRRKGICPCCGKTIYTGSLEDGTDDFECHYCGQKLDWNKY